MSSKQAEDLVSFCKRKGFMYPTCEIYGSIAGFYDYGTLGTLLKQRFQNVWRNYFLHLNTSSYEIEPSEVMHEQTFVASGHLKNFADFVAQCENGHVERADSLLEQAIGKRVEGLSKDDLLNELKKHSVRCPTCKKQFSSVEPLNMMFPLQVGVGISSRVFLRPETAQSPYVNFLREFEANRKKLPLGLAVIGKAYRNEISPRNFVLRQRAFTQAELQLFFNPSTFDTFVDFDSIKEYQLLVCLADQRSKQVQKIDCKQLSKKLPKWYVYHLAKVQKFYLETLQLDPKKFRLYQLADSEKAFYNLYHFDIELELDQFGWTEVGGVHYRTDHDLKGHQEISKKSMTVLDEASGKKILPHVLELSFGVDRHVFSLISLAYEHNSSKDYTILHLAPVAAPYSCAVFPLISKGDSHSLAVSIYEQLSKKMSVFLDSSGSIGRRYARQDEVGTPYCITVDESGVSSGLVTIRDRDSSKQIHVPVTDLERVVQGLVSGEIEFKNAGKMVNSRNL